MGRTKDETIRHRLLDAALTELLAGRSLTAEGLAEAVGVSRATVYRRFPSMDAVRDALRQERGLPLPAAPGSTSEQLLSAALAVVERDGLHGATMRQVARAAGVGVATVYNHVHDKAGLLMALVEAYGPRALSGQLAALPLPPGSDLEGPLAGWVVPVLGYLRARRGLIRVLLAPDPEARAALQAVLEATREPMMRLAGYLDAQGGDGPALLRSLLGLLLAHSLLEPASAPASAPVEAGAEPEAEVEVAARALVRQFLRGAALNPRG